MSRFFCCRNKHPETLIEEEGTINNPLIKKAKIYFRVQLLFAITAALSIITLLILKIVSHNIFTKSGCQLDASSFNKTECNRFMEPYNSTSYDFAGYTSSKVTFALMIITTIILSILLVTLSSLYSKVKSIETTENDSTLELGTTKTTKEADTDSESLDLSQGELISL